jgi:hypothetical protein
MWMPWPEGRPSNVGRTSAVDHVLSRVRHPSFSPELAEELVRGLSHRRLRRLWSETSRILATTMSDETRLNVVVFRDHLLRELERYDASAAHFCARADARAGVRGRRADRS